MKKKYLVIICISLFLIGGISGVCLYNFMGLSDISSSPPESRQMGYYESYAQSLLAGEITVEPYQSAPIIPQVVPTPTTPSTLYKEIYLKKAEQYQKRANDYLSGVQLWQYDDSKFGQEMYKHNLDDYLYYQSKANEYILKALRE